MILECGAFDPATGERGPELDRAVPRGVSNPSSDRLPKQPLSTNTVAGSSRGSRSQRHRRLLRPRSCAGSCSANFVRRTLPSDAPFRNGEITSSPSICYPQVTHGSPLVVHTESGCFPRFSTGFSPPGARRPSASQPFVSLIFSVFIHRNVYSLSTNATASPLVRFTNDFREMVGCGQIGRAFTSSSARRHRRPSRTPPRSDRAPRRCRRVPRPRRSPRALRCRRSRAPSRHAASAVR